MYTLDARTQNALYKAHKSKTLGLEMVEIAIPKFNDLDTLTSTGNQHQSLRNACFEFSVAQGNNVFINVDNATRTNDTVLHTSEESG